MQPGTNHLALYGRFLRDSFSLSFYWGGGGLSQEVLDYSFQFNLSNIKYFEVLLSKIGASARSSSGASSSLCWAL